MTAREQLVAYIATLAALVIVFIAALLAARSGVDAATIGQAFGLGTITGGLIGVLRIPSARTPVASTESGDISVAPTPAAPPADAQS